MGLSRSFNASNQVVVGDVTMELAQMALPIIRDIHYELPGNG